MILHSGLGFAKQFFCGGWWCGWIQLLVARCDLETVVFPSDSCSLRLLSLHVCCVLSALAPLSIVSLRLDGFLHTASEPTRIAGLIKA